MKIEAAQEYFGFRKPDILKKLPVAVNYGNHEAGSELYKKQFQKDGEKGMEYSFLYKNVLFIGLDTFSGDMDEQIEYLKRTIENHPADWVVVTMHYSLFSAGSHAFDETIVRYRERLAPVFSQYDVDLVLAGHDHSYTRGYLMNGVNSTGKEAGKKEPGEVLYLTGGSSTGNKYYGKNKAETDYTAFFLEEKVPVITAVKAGKESLEIRTYDVLHGKEVDSCVISKDYHR